MSEQIRRRFVAFHERHPEVWLMFLDFTFQAIRAGRRRFSARVIFGAMRWNTALNSDDGDGWKLNDHYSPYYARKFMHEYPQHASFFETRDRVGGAS